MCRRAGRCEINPLLHKGCHLLKRASTVLPILEIRVRDPDARKAWVVLPYRDQTIWLKVRQGGQYGALHHAEHGGVGADAEGKSEHSDGRKPRRSRQHSNPIFQILPERLHRFICLEGKIQPGVDPSIIFLIVWTVCWDAFFL